jgi:hypothetical protein
MPAMADNIFLYVLIAILVLIGFYVIVRLASFGIFTSWFQARRVYVQKLLTWKKKKEEEEKWRRQEQK